jgi:hypothetical protein
MCDYRSAVARTTHFGTGARDTVPEDGVCFSSKIVITSGSFALGQVLNFGSLDYVIDQSIEHHPLEETLLEDNESLASYHPLGLLGAILKVLGCQIWPGLGPKPTVSVRC